MIFKKFLDFKQDVENQFTNNEQKLQERLDGLLDRRRYQISIVM